MSLDPVNFITRSPLESLSIRYSNELTEFIADKVFPPVIQSKRSFKVWQADTSNMRARVTLKANDAEADTLDYGGFYTNRDAQPHKISAKWDPADEIDADRPVADIENESAMAITEALMLAREVEAATLATTSGNYPSDLTAALTGGTDTWLDAGGDPALNSKTARLAVRARCGKEANAMALSRTGLANLQQNPALKDQLKYTSAGSIPVEMLKNVLMVQHIFVGGAQNNTNMEGNSTQTLSDVWNDSALFFVYDPTPRLRKVCYGQGYMRNQLYSYRYQLNERGSGDGRIQKLEMGWTYIQAAGAVVSSSDGDFAAGYLLRNIF